jgi:hypothetical protein
MPFKGSNEYLRVSRRNSVRHAASPPAHSTGTILAWGGLCVVKHFSGAWSHHLASFRSLLTNTLHVGKESLFSTLYLSKSPGSEPFWCRCHVHMPRPSALFSLLKQVFVTTQPLPVKRFHSWTFTACYACLCVPHLWNSPHICVCMYLPMCRQNVFAFIYINICTCVFYYTSLCLCWREELHNLYSSLSIIRVMKSRKTSLGRSKRRWKIILKQILKK